MFFFPIAASTRQACLCVRARHNPIKQEDIAIFRKLRSDPFEDISYSGTLEWRLRLRRRLSEALICSYGGVAFTRLNKHLQQSMRYRQRFMSNTRFTKFCSIFQHSNDIQIVVIHNLWNISQGPHFLGLIRRWAESMSVHLDVLRIFVCWNRRMLIDLAVLCFHVLWPSEKIDHCKITNNNNNNC